MTTPPPLKLPYQHITRGQMLLTSILALITALFYFVPSFPFHPGFCMAGLVSAAFHFMLFLFFDRLLPPSPHSLIPLSIFNIAVLGAVMHFTGGLLSPFSFLFIVILTSEAAYAIEYPVGTIGTIIVYGLIIAAEYYGVIQPIDVSPSRVYQSGITTFFVATVSISYFLVTGLIHKFIMKNLREKLMQEEAAKQTYLKQLTKLEAPSQVGLLVNKIVHDIRGPLGAVTGFLKMFGKESNLSAQTREDCEIIVNELERISRLVHHMVRYTKPGTTEKKNLCPVELMETVLSVISFHPSAKGVKVKRVFMKSNQNFVHANQEELQQVYFNIIKNAIEAVEGNMGERVIEVIIELKDAHVAIEVNDNGPGIAPQILKTLLSETQSTKRDGAGVGLVIVREIIQGHGGKVVVNSMVGAGTKIRTSLPLATESVAA